MKKSTLQAITAADIFDVNMVLDITMKTVAKNCPKCGYKEAVFYLSTDNEQRKMISYYICAKQSAQFTPSCFYRFTDKDKAIDE